ncbi:hypothetical protein NUH87_28350 [Pseudomonas batumici]|uniref:hypothetical protein n=1 Tax=Pseudomonas batumici TaxID=226910 RepID=UPI0030CAC3D8
MRTVIVTNCTNRKRLDGLPPVVLKDQCYSSIAAMAKAWMGQIDERPTTLTASSLYVGRSVSDARRVAIKLDAKLMFASTGLGLVEGDHKCPPYNLTVAQDPNSIIPRLEKLGAQASDWWEAMNATQSKGSAIADLVSQPDVDLVLIALSSNYLQLIGEDLRKIRDVEIDKLRIFTSRPGIEMLPSHLRRIAMPYDERLETSTLPGTRNDFPQRALRHFVEVLDLSNAPAETARKSVGAAMDLLSRAKTTIRRRASDDEITFMLECAWARHQGSSTRLLRYLRDEALVSCEQSRFRRIWQDIKGQDSIESNA